MGQLRRQLRRQPSARSLGFVFLAGAVLSLAAASTYGADKDKEKWTYVGPTGPVKWGDLNKDFEECKLGQTQAPIDIPDAKARKGDLPSLLFDYKPVPLRIIDNGHTIQVNYDPGSFLMVSGKKYELLQFHFHKPSEEKIDGKGQEMDAHLVHQTADHKLGVVAVQLDAGAENPMIKTLWNNLPKEKGKESAVPAVMINAKDLLPKNKGYYTFSGSLTTPPCSEDVTWFVLKTPVPISADSIARFASRYPMNARPVQPINSRDIQSTR
jgi:carbonic anhydrase